MTSFFETRFSKFLSRLTGWVATLNLPKALRMKLLHMYCKKYKVNVEEIAQPLESFQTFNSFFTRALKINSRPIASASNQVISPVDGKILSLGNLEKGELIQAKSIHYTLSSLCPIPEIQSFQGGGYITFYLSPGDCHRIFSPLSATVKSSCHVPGHVFPVKESVVSRIQVFTKNERLISLLDTPKGQMALIMVGAFNVGSMGVNYDPSIETNKGGKQIHTKQYKEKLHTEKGSHFGTFYLGSTVILCWTPGLLKLNKKESDLGSHIKYGQSIGTLL